MEPSGNNREKVFGSKKKTASYATASTSSGVSKPAGNEGTRGKSSMHGSSYHLRMAMVALLRAVILRRQGTLFDFKITMEDPNAGKFDDVVLCYSLPSLPEEFSYVYIQAKHKLTSDSVKKVPSITEASLLTKWNSKAPFSIPMYFMSYLEGYKPTFNESQTYILCTNATLDENLKKYFTVRNHESDHLLSFFDDIGATCYSFNYKKEFKTMVDELRNSSVEKLGQMIAIQVKQDKRLESNISMFNINVYLIAKCVEQLDSGTFQFNDEFRKSDNTSLIGKLRRSFEQEYLKQTTKKEVKWEDVRIMTDHSFSKYLLDNINHSESQDAFYYEAIDVAIQQFFNEFLLVCGSMNETELSEKILNIMPKWVSNRKSTYNNLQDILLSSMNKSSDITWQDLKQHFIETNTNDTFNRVQTFTNQYLDSMRIKYSHIIVKSDCLEETELNDFMSRISFGDVHRYRCTTNMKMNSLIVSQTFALHEYQCLFVDSTASQFQANICDVLCELMEFIAAVDLSTKYIITILGQQKIAALKAIKNYAKSYKMKIIVVEEPAEEDLSEDGLFVRDLIEETRKELFKSRFKVKLFGATTSLDRVVRDDDSLNLLFSVLDKYNEAKTTENLNLNDYGKIESWYISRSCVPFSEDKPESEQYLVEKEITAALLQSIISLNHESGQLPDALNYEGKVKVHIFLDEAGFGKSTYFTWLASALSNNNSSLFVIRMNALQYSTDFYELQASNARTFDDTTVIRILYRLLHLTLFVSNVNIKSNKAADEERRKADSIAQFLKVSRGKITLDEGGIRTTLCVDELLQLRLFQIKFNEKQITCLLDGFDEVAPHYKDFVMKYFARLANFEGIRNLYLSTRPYNFTGELNQSFSVCKMWRLEPFSQRDRILFLNNYLEHGMECYKISSESHRLTILENMYTLTVHSVQQLKIIPLFLHMAAKISLSKLETLPNIQQQTISPELFEETKFDQLQIISLFVDEKLRILNNEKAGNLDIASKNPVQRMMHDEANKQIKRRHTLLAMLVIFNTKGSTMLLSEQEQKEAIEFKRKIAEGNEKTGIIREVRDGDPVFTHRIFAEYFAAFWLYNNKHLMRSESFFRSWEYWNGEEHGTRDFFNRMIIKNSQRYDIHMAVINQSELQVRELLSTDPSVAFVKDAAGRLPLHTAVMYPSVKIQQMLIENMPLQSINTKDELFQWTALDYAFAGKCNIAIKTLLTAKAEVNKNTLLQQVLSNNLRNMLIFAHDIALWLQCDDNCKRIAEKLRFELVEHLINVIHIDILSYHKELDSLTILEFCSKCNMIDLFIQFISRMYSPGRISTHETNQLLQNASENKAYDIEAYLTEHIKMLLPQLESIVDLISVVKSSITDNHWYLFNRIFQILCLQLNIHLMDDTVEDDHAPGGGYIPSMDKDHYPNICCVRSSENVRLSLPEYDEKDVLHDGYLVEALLAAAVHEGNMQMVKYIVQKTNMPITNRLIVMVMRLSPKEGESVCHEKSMSAFIYLLERTTDLDSTDEEGRNLLHMTAQNGCFFMLCCLIATGFDPTVTNIRNGWNVFHYAAFNDDDDRTDKILEFLLITCDFNWFDHLDRLVESDTESLHATTIQNTLHTKKLNKRQHALLAMYVIYGKKELIQLMPEQELQEAVQCLQEISRSNLKSDFIQEVRTDVPQFTYRIFAEYFAASWLHNNKHLMKIKSFFRSWRFWSGSTGSSKQHRTRDFLNRIIVRDSERNDIHMAVINQSELQFRELLFKDPSVAFVKDAAGRLPLHLVVMYPSEEIEQMLLEIMPLQSINTKDELFRWTALDYAFANRYKNTVKKLLTVGAAVNEDILLQQILSNNVWGLVYGAYFYGTWLQSHEHSQMIANRLHIRTIEYLFDVRQVDVLSRHEELDSLTVLEFCSKHNMIGVFKQLVSQFDIRERISTELSSHLFQIASTNKSHDIVAFFVDSNDMLLPQMQSVAQLVAATKSCIKLNRMTLFKNIFLQLCFQLNIHLVDDTDIVENDHAPDDANIPSMDKDHYPKICCVRSFANVRLSLPEYNEKDSLHDGYLIEALLAAAVHEGNMQMVKYIVQKTNMPITNRLIVMIMRLLPKEGETVCHQKSISAFIYLLEKTTDLDSTDEEGRNLLHMTAQNGCFFMLRCLIANGFDSSGVNLRNGCDVFCYAAFDQDEDRQNKVERFIKEMRQ